MTYNLDSQSHQVQTRTLTVDTAVEQPGKLSCAHLCPSSAAIDVPSVTVAEEDKCKEELLPDRCCVTRPRRIWLAEGVAAQGHAATAVAPPAIEVEDGRTSS